MDWPGTLPVAVDRDGYEETFVDSSIRTEMDAGEPKVRKRFTAAIQPITIKLRLTDTQVTTLETFYKTDTASGSLSFNWTHPRKGTACVMRFQGPPRIRALEHEAEATFVVNILP